VPHEGQTQSGSFLDRLLEENEAFAKRLGEHLKDRVFEHIFPQFAEGFIQGSGGPARLLALSDQQREAELSDCFQATLTFLYCLLFLLYAKSRDLLPVRETRGYREASLTKLKEEVTRAAGTLEDQVRKNLEKAYRNDSPALYDRAVERIRARPYLLIIDEADRLSMDCFEILRDFWDDFRLPMLLVGNEGLTEKLNRQHERLFRRIRVRFEQRPLREAEMRKVLEVMGYEMEDSEFALLWKLVGGSPGFAEALLENANEIAESKGMKRGIEALEGAVRYFPTVRK
jgi:hypothetical protein